MLSVTCDPRAIAVCRARENIDSISVTAPRTSIRSMNPDARGSAIAVSAAISAMTTVVSMSVNAFRFRTIPSGRNKF
jgi:hypothetical protein